jgi:hypothetical protein
MSQSPIQQFLNIVKNDHELLTLLNTQIGSQSYVEVFMREASFRGFNLNIAEVEDWERTARLAYDAGELSDEELEFVAGGATTTTTKSTTSGTNTTTRRRSVSFA